MKGTDFSSPSPAAPPAARNGVHRAAKKSSAHRDRSETREGCDAAKAPLAAPFAIVEIAPADAPAWPVHAAAWLQPELAPSAPAWSGLAVERHNRIPSPGFLDAGPAPLDRPDRLDADRGALRAGAAAEIPDSSLEPLGWDPRTACRKEGTG